MYFPSIVLATTLVGSALAGPIDRRVAHFPQKWDITKFEYGCDAGECHYSFDILGHSTKKVPGFATTCKGELNHHKPKLISCKDIDILSSVYSNPKGAAKPYAILISHAWDENGDIASGSRNLTKHEINNLHEFTMHQTQVDSCEFPCE